MAFQKTFLLLALASITVHAELSAPGKWAATAPTRYQITPNITYLVANGHEDKLDIYQRRDATGPQPTLIWIHGGGPAAQKKRQPCPFCRGLKWDGTL
jgi:acetyl esterase/lipase